MESLTVDPVPIVTIPWTVPQCQSGFWSVLSTVTVYYHGCLPVPQYILAWPVPDIVHFSWMFAISPNVLPKIPPTLRALPKIWQMRSPDKLVGPFGRFFGFYLWDHLLTVPNCAWLLMASFLLVPAIPGYPIRGTTFQIGSPAFWASTWHPLLTLWTLLGSGYLVVLIDIVYRYLFI